MNKVLKYLIDNSNLKYVDYISTGRERGAALELIDDFIVELIDDRDSGSNNEGLYIYINNVKHAKILLELFYDEDGKYDKNSIAHSYSPRKLRKDTYIGNLAMGLSSVEDEQNFKLSNGGVIYSALELCSIIDKIITAKDIINLFNDEKFNNFLGKLEGFWVFLFISCYSGLKPEAIYRYLSSEDGLLQSKAWRLKKKLDIEIINLYYEQYKEVMC